MASGNLGEVVALEKGYLRGAQRGLIRGATPRLQPGYSRDDQNPMKPIALEHQFDTFRSVGADFGVPSKGMQMTVLVLVLCLQSAPDSCTEQRPFADLPLSACLKRGEQYALAWLADHPKWALSRWRCEINVPPERPT